MMSTRPMQLHRLLLLLAVTMALMHTAAFVSITQSIQNSSTASAIASTRSTLTALRISSNKTVVLSLIPKPRNVTKPANTRFLNTSRPVVNHQTFSTTPLTSAESLNYSQMLAPTISLQRPSKGEQMDATNISSILDSLLLNYDKRLRPNYGAEPVEVGVTIFVSSISAVSEVEMDFTLDLYLRQIWTDSRLRFTGSLDSLTVGIDMVKDIWVPDTFFPNEKKSFFHTATTHNSFLRISPSGEVLRSLRLTVTAMCPMDLRYFPLDKQNCSLEIESYGYSSKDITYKWKKGNGSVAVSEDVNLAQFTIGSHKIEERMIELSTGNYSRLSCYFNFSRNVGFYLIQIYLPSSLIVIISWVSFWLNREATQARVAIGVTTVLTMTTLMTSTNASMPKVSYVKSIDIYLGTCFIIVFASLLEYAAVGYLLKRMRMKKEKGGDSGGPSSMGSTVAEGSLGPGMDTSRSPLPTGRMAALPGYPLNSVQALELQPLTGATQRQSSFKFSQVQQSQTASYHSIPSRGATVLLPKLECDCDIEAGSEGISRPVRLRPKYKKQSFKPSSIDKYSRIFFPLTFTFFHIVYWSIYLDLLDTT